MNAIAELEMDIDFASSELRRLYADVTASIVRVTPMLAAKWLERNTCNRPLNKKHIAFLKDVMEAGDMVLNGETLIFSPDGTLLNGQHRLSACVASGLPYDSVVIRGIDTEHFRTMDAGRARRAGDYLAIGGETNVFALGAAIQAIVTFCTNGGIIRDAGGSRKATGPICDRFLEKHPGIRESLLRMRRNSLFRTQHAVALHYLFRLIDRDLADDFSSILADGPAGSSDRLRPFNTLREQFIATPLKNHNRIKYAAKAIKAFNAERRGISPKTFSFGDREDFPMIDGLNYDRLEDIIS